MVGNRIYPIGKRGTEDFRDRSKADLTFQDMSSCGVQSRLVGDRGAKENELGDSGGPSDLENKALNEARGTGMGKKEDARVQACMSESPSKGRQGGPQAASCSRAWDPSSSMGPQPRRLSSAYLDKIVCT